MHNLIGRGGFANVYRAKSLGTGQEVAIKMVRTVKTLLKFATSAKEMRTKTIVYIIIMISYLMT